MFRPANLSLAAGLLLVSSFSLGMRAHGAPHPGSREAKFNLQLSVTPASATVTTDLHFHLRLKSQAAQPWLVYPDLQQGPGASFDLFVKDHVSGKEVSPPFFADAHTPGGPVHLARLLPGQAIEADVTDQPQSFGMQPGHTYDVIAVYHSPIHQRSQKRLPILSDADGSLSSNTVRLVLLP